ECVNAGGKFIERHSRPGGQAAPDRILRLVRTGQVLAVILIDRAQIGTELIAGECAGEHSAVEERAVVVGAVPLDQHRSDEPAIGSSVNDNSPGLAEAIDKILACLIGILGGLLHAKSEISISRSNPGIAE